jgi:hypothetical protein
MKLVHLTTLALGLFAVSPMLSAQSSWGSFAGVTLTLTQTAEAPALPEKGPDGKNVVPAALTKQNEFTIETLANDPELGPTPVRTVRYYEAGSKQVVYRLGNANLIKAMFDAQALPVATGWSLQVISDAEGLPTSVILRNSSRTIQPVSVDGIGYTVGSLVSTITARATETENTPLVGEPSYSSTASYSSSYKGVVTGVSLPSSVFGSTEGSIGGFITGSERLVLKSYRDELGETFVDQVYVPGAIKIDRIFSSVGSPVSEDPVILEGSISVGAGVLVDLGLYLPTL